MKKRLSVSVAFMIFYAGEGWAGGAVDLSPTVAYTVASGSNSTLAPELLDLRIRNMGGTDARTRKAVATFDLRSFSDAQLAAAANISISFQLDSAPGSLTGTASDTIKFYALLIPESMIDSYHSWDDLVTAGWHTATAAVSWNGEGVASLLGNSVQQTAELAGQLQYFTHTKLDELIKITLANASQDNVLAIGMASGVNGPLYNLDSVSTFRLHFETVVPSLSLIIISSR